MLTTFSYFEKKCATLATMQTTRALSVRPHQYEVEDLIQQARYVSRVNKEFYEDADRRASYGFSPESDEVRERLSKCNLRFED